MSNDMRVIQENERITVKWYVDHAFDEPSSFRLWCDNPDKNEYGKKSVVVEWKGNEYTFTSFWVTGAYFYATSDDKRDSFDMLPIREDATIRFVRR